MVGGSAEWLPDGWSLLGRRARLHPVNDKPKNLPASLPSRGNSGDRGILAGDATSEIHPSRGGSPLAFFLDDQGGGDSRKSDDGCASRDPCDRAGNDFAYDRRGFHTLPGP